MYEAIVCGNARLSIVSNSAHACASYGVNAQAKLSRTSSTRLSFGGW